MKQRAHRRADTARARALVLQFGDARAQRLRVGERRVALERSKRDGRVLEFELTRRQLLEQHVVLARQRRFGVVLRRVRARAVRVARVAERASGDNAHECRWRPSRPFVCAL